MLALLQRVSSARVDADGRTVGAIGPGLLVLVCAMPSDTGSDAERLVDRLLALRVFADAAGRMNLDLKAAGGGLLLVPQFTLAADTRKGTRPGFSRAAEPGLARRLFDHVLSVAAGRHAPVAAGVFGAHMAVSLTNDGPVTLWLDTAAGSGS
jgi:D-tyrosyl-tRNA(Tyr) deacylase